MTNESLPTTTTTSADQLDAMLSSEQITQEQYDELRQALETPQATADSAGMSRPPLQKCWSTRQIGGLGAGIANHLGVSPFLVRILAIVALCVAPPITLIVYVASCFSLPWDAPSAARESQEEGHPRLFAGTLSAICLIQIIFALFAVPSCIALFHEMGVKAGSYTQFWINIHEATNPIFGIFGQIILVAILTMTYLVIHKPNLRKIYAGSIIILLLFRLLAIMAAFLLPISGMISKV